jgi:hypothetical protein
VKDGKYILALIVLSLIVFVIGATLFGGGSDNSYTDFMLTLIAVHLVASKLSIKREE